MFYIAKKKRPLIRLAALLIALAMAAAPVDHGAGIPYEVHAKSVADINDTVSVQNIMSVMNAYDKDGAYLAGYALAYSSFYNMLTYSYFDASDRNIDTLDTVVHEAFHEYGIPDYTSTTASGRAVSERIYIGNKKHVNVNFTEVFPSREMAKSVPKRCRTAAYHYNSGDRFKTYIVDQSHNQRSDVDGAYGLLNEFGGYCWGFNNTVSQYAYRDKFDDTYETWNTFISEGESDLLSYAEMRYYILHYLYFAKQHHPDVYRGIAGNSSFRKAYRLLNNVWKKNIAKYEKQLDSVREKLKTGDNINITDDKLILRRQYRVMTKEMTKKQYRIIENAITKK